MQQEFVDLYDAEIDLQKIYGAAPTSTGDMTSNDSHNNSRAIAAPAAFLNYTSYKGFAMGQAGFAKTFVLPTWKSIAVLIPSFQYLVQRIEDNIAKYKEIAEN